jgi:hypothetical protein
MQPKKPPRILGPYREGNKWRVITIGVKGRRSQIARSEAEAHLLKRHLMAALSPVVPIPTRLWLFAALREYEAHLQRQRSRQTLARTMCTLRAFLPEQQSPLSAITPRIARELARFEHPGTRRIRRCYAASTRRAVLGHVRRFYDWTLQRRYISENPFVGVAPTGLVGTATRRPYADELPRFAAAALCEADGGDTSALGALLLVTANLRSVQVLRLRVGDIDLEGPRLQLAQPGGPTWRSLPSSLVPTLRAVIESRHPSELLLGTGRTGQIRPRNYLWRAVHRLCLAARVTPTCPRFLGTAAGSDGVMATRLSRRLVVRFARKRALHTPSLVRGRPRVPMPIQPELSEFEQALEQRVQRLVPFMQALLRYRTRPSGT